METQESTIICSFKLFLRGRSKEHILNFPDIVSDQLEITSRFNQDGVCRLEIQTGKSTYATADSELVVRWTFRDKEDQWCISGFRFP